MTNQNQKEVGACTTGHLSKYQIQLGQLGQLGEDVWWAGQGGEFEPK